MIEIICQGKSPSEAKAKCMVTEMLLTEKISTGKAINVLNAIGGICIKESEYKAGSEGIRDGEMDKN